MLSFKEFMIEAEDPCWKGYRQLGMKDKNGKEVPNCIPEEEEYCDACDRVVSQCICDQEIDEATYQGKKVPLNKPMKGDVKKSKVYVDLDGDGKAKKVNFGDPNMTIKKDQPARRRSFRARHNCDNPGPKDKARYWSCKAW